MMDLIMIAVLAGSVGLIYLLIGWTGASKEE
mgnify:CR=1 FL=1